MPEEPGNQASNRIGCSKSGGEIGESPRKASGIRVHRGTEMGGESWGSPREGRWLSPCP